MVTRVETQTELLLTARTAHVRQDWHASYEAFVRASEAVPLSTDDLEALAVAAWRLGRGKESVRAAERVFTQLSRTDPQSAAMKAVELGLAWINRGDLNIGQGWMSRAHRLLDAAPEGPPHGYLAYLDAAVAVFSEGPEELRSRVMALRGICGRVDDPAVTALCRLAEAVAAILDARMTEAFGLLDEALLPVLAGQVPIEWAGDIYCTVVHYCHRLADLPRMRAWTQSMERWCDDFAASATYGGICDVHRLQLLAATDDYRRLQDRLAAVSRSLEDVNVWAAGEGYYQLGEALLRCRMDDHDTAWTDLRLALAGEDRIGRMRLLRAAVDVALARGDLDEAERHCDELESGAEVFGTPGFRAWAAHARGAILGQQGRHAESLDALRASLREYRTQQSRYETAQVYEWMAVAHKSLGDDALAAADAATAENIYAQLGVEPAQVCGHGSPGDLTPREIEILRRIADGATNKQVAEQVYISEKTVGRHLANIYAKLGVSSRTAAVAWAHANNLL